MKKKKNDTPGQIQRFWGTTGTLKNGLRHGGGLHQRILRYDDNPNLTVSTAVHQRTAARVYPRCCGTHIGGSCYNFTTKPAPAHRNTSTGIQAPPFGGSKNSARENSAQQPAPHSIAHLQNSSSSLGIACAHAQSCWPCTVKLKLKKKEPDGPTHYQNTPGYYCAINPLVRLDRSRSPADCNASLLFVAGLSHAPARGVLHYC